MKCTIHGKKHVVNARASLLVAAACTIMSMVAVADVYDVTITSSGMSQFEAGGEYGSIVNAASGEVTLTSSGAAVAADAISVTNFDATVAGATTVFDGGWWDFGVADSAAGTVNFMTKDSTLSNRSVTLDNGAVVTNVGWAYLAGTSGSNNSLTLDGASSLTANNLVFSRSTASRQLSKVTVGGGSHLNVRGMLSMSDGQEAYANNAMSGNELVVSGAGSRLVVGGQTSLGRNMGSSSYSTSGSNTFTVVDGASATLQGLVVAAGGRHGNKNRVVFGKNARVNMTSLSFAAGGTGVVTGPGGNTLEILDGAVVTNTGEFTFGIDHQSSINNHIVVSNATFHYGSSYGYSGGGDILIIGRQSELTLSGPGAKLTHGKVPQGYFFGVGNSLVIENGAQYVLPCSTYSYTKACKCETMRFCSGASVTHSANSIPFGTGNTYYTAGTSNSLEVTSGASFTVEGSNGHMKLVGDYGRLLVDDGSLSVKSSLYIGTNGLDNANAKEFIGQTFHIAGSHPYVRVKWNVYLTSDATLVFGLPPGGYDSGFATAEKPVIYGGENDAHRMVMSAGSTSRIVFENAEEFMRSHEKRRDYVLIKGANDNYLNSLTAERLAQMSEGFPEGLSLENTGSQLILHVRPKRGFVLSYR